MLKHYLQAVNTAYTPTLAKAIGNSISTDAFLREVSEFISKQTDQPLVLENYPIAGLEIDLVVVYEGRTYCIDLIGFPGAYEMALPLERWRMLERLGIPCFALSYSQWVSRSELSQQALKKFLQVD
ncbi:hypothetical protein [Lewinella sp. LCG006]|uniref:hypothetical protein n=1 Tax=Lewinella sp. LCG006 TaxID=3231911 RepID=UPI0034601B63